MTRINTNVSSLIAQKQLGRSNAQLQIALQRLSTGLRINVGKDDPAGLIASEILRSDIVATQRAISNSERANQIIATADSALGQVSALLNDIRGLVSEAANTGALSDEQIEANQLQVDSSLEAIDRIAQTTSFQGRRLLDGSLDFLTTNPGLAQLRASGTIGTGVDATSTGSFGGGADTIQLSASTVGSRFNATVVVNSADVASSATFNTATFTLTVTRSAAATAAEVASAINTNGVFQASATGAGAATVTAGTTTSATTGGSDNNRLILSATAGGAAFNGSIVVVANTSGPVSASYNTGANTLTILTTAAAAVSEVISAVNQTGAYSASTNGAGYGILTAGTYVGVTSGGVTGGATISDLKIDQANFGTASSINVEVEIDRQATQATLTLTGSSLASDLVLELGGSRGFTTLNFGAGTGLDDVADAINVVSDATGVEAAIASGAASGSILTLQSIEYGSDAFISARVLNVEVGGRFDTINTAGVGATRTNGTDVDLRINGVQATGDGLRAVLNTATLDLNFSVNRQMQDGDSFSFAITGGGANFQIGPDVVSNQQARIGIQGLSTATLGGVSGKLYELRTGGPKDLFTDTKGAARVVDEVIATVTGLRGRLGAFQKTTLETNIITLGDALDNLTEAESLIRDADFAAESARLTRAQILVQSGGAVLAIANQNPTNVLALLR
jgi:flagellin